MWAGGPHVAGGRGLGRQFVIARFSDGHEAVLSERQTVRGLEAVREADVVRRSEQAG